ncbi:MAG: cytochrome c biogenesis protein CcsA [Spirochaetes bacterium]|nr:cytochrome c biogenesis protein CcsA [Spirochaetota bacterium]
MPASIILTFLYAPPAEVLGDAGRIIFYHVPLAWISVLAFVVAGFYAAVHLFSKSPRAADADMKSHVSATLGMFFAVLTTVTGSIWAKLSWGSYWNWDPRETTIMVLLLIYIAYLSLHGTLKDGEKRGRICASYLLIAAATVPFFVFIVPRLYPTLHPDPILNREASVHMDFRMRITLICTIASFTLLYLYLFGLRFRIAVLEKVRMGIER